MTRKLHRRSRSRTLLLCTAALVALGGILAGPAAARVAHVKVPGDPAGIADYWTPKRMSHATPVDLPTLPDGSEGTGKPPKPQGPPVSIPPRLLAGEAAQDSSPQPRAGTLYPYEPAEITDPTAFPARVHGKVFFSRGGRNFVCSGTVVNGSNDSTVLTAGHCVWDGSWSTNFAFVPGYGAGGSAPYGVWPASNLFSTQQWVPSENLRYDMGAAVIRRDQSDREIEDVVGARGIAFNLDATAQHWISYGYPADSDGGTKPQFNGYRLWTCESDYALADSTHNTIGIGCDMTGGSSGGGWVVNDQDVNGLNSYKILNVPVLDEVMFGPYFGDTAQSLFNFASGQAPGSVSRPQQVTQPTTPTSKKKCKKAKKKRGGKKKRCKKG
jgi:V8-like Glu-specific endopeptidase